MAQQEDGSLKLVHEGYNTVAAVPYDVPIVGYHNNVVNTLESNEAFYLHKSYLLDTSKK